MLHSVPLASSPYLQPCLCFLSYTLLLFHIDLSTGPFSFTAKAEPSEELFPGPKEGKRGDRARRSGATPIQVGLWGRRVLFCTSESSRKALLSFNQVWRCSVEINASCTRCIDWVLQGLSTASLPPNVTLNEPIS